jgi:hypothetical protein
MKIGLLWFDNDAGRDLTAKVARAAAHYRQKYGKLPQLCYVNPAALNGHGDSMQIAAVEVRGAKSVLPNHFWLGVKQEAGTMANDK